MRSSILLEAIGTYGTPSYLFDIDEVRERSLKIQKLLRDRVTLCYAMKANPFLVRAMDPVISKFEVCSPGEFRICRKSGIDPVKIVLSGVSKIPADLTAQMGYILNKGVYTIESLKQLEDLEREADSNDIVIRGLLRITGGNQFGMDEETACQVISRRTAYPHVDITGLQYFTGTQKRKFSRIRAELEYMDSLITKLQDVYGFKTKELEYGPGFYVPYFMDEAEQDDERLIHAFNELIGSLSYQGHITLECGRYLAAYCGYYVTSVTECKASKDQRYALVDGGIHQLNYYGQMMAMKVPHYKQIPGSIFGDQTSVTEIDLNSRSREPADAAAGNTLAWQICGSLCTVNDVLVKNLPLRDLQQGDVICFERAGAYSVTESMALFLSRDLPQVIMTSDRDGLKLVRKRLEADELNSY